MSIFHLLAQALIKTAEEPDRGTIDLYRFMHPVQPLLKPEANKPGYSFQDYALRMNDQVFRETGWEPGYLGRSLFTGPRTRERQQALESIPFGAFPIHRLDKMTGSVGFNQNVLRGMTIFRKDPRLPGWLPERIEYPPTITTARGRFTTPTVSELTQSHALGGPTQEMLAHEVGHIQQQDQDQDQPWTDVATEYAQTRPIPEEFRAQVREELRAINAFRQQFLANGWSNQDAEAILRYYLTATEFPVYMVTLQRLYRVLQKDPAPRVQDVYEFAKPLMTAQVLDQHVHLLPLQLVSDTRSPEAKGFLSWYLNLDDYKRAVRDTFQQADNIPNYEPHIARLRQLRQTPGLRDMASEGMLHVGNVVMLLWSKQQMQLSQVARDLVRNDRASGGGRVPTEQEISQQLAFWKYSRPDLRDAAIPLSDQIRQEIQETRRQLEEELKDRSDLRERYQQMNEASRQELAAQLWSMRESIRTLPMLRNFLLRAGLISSAFLVQNHRSRQIPSLG